MTDEDLIEITDVNDVRPGDLVTTSFMGHEVIGEAWDEGRENLYVGADCIRGAGRSLLVEFVRATRSRPTMEPLPTDDGTLIVATTTKEDREWVLVHVCGAWEEFYEETLVLDEQILFWRPVYFAVKDDNGDLQVWEGGA